jgi:hypothetical protein
MQRNDRDPLIEPEMPEAARLAFGKRGPVNRGDARAHADLELIERGSSSRHFATDYQ